MNPLERGDRERPRTAALGYIQFLSLGLQFTLMVGICIFGGYWIDNKVGSTPWGMLLGAAFGFTAGMVFLYRAVFATSSRRESAER